MGDSFDPRMLRAEARVGQLLREKWRLERLIGVGGMASVYAATHRNRMRGAVKMLHVELSGSADARTRFLREGYVANNVEHPGVVRVLDDDVAEDGSVFLVMELLEGQTLESLAEARPGRRFQVGEVLAIADELLDVLAAAHDRGIVHRDLKPENLFLTKAGQLKVLDFGIARLREMSTASNATATGMTMGTPAYMPPEQALGNWDAVDARSDLWAVGATMFALLTGRVVHHADTVQKLMLAAMTSHARTLGSVAPELPPMVCSIVDSALAFEMDHRWPDARSMQRAVRALRTSFPHAFAPPPVPAAPTALSPLLHESGGTPVGDARPALTPAVVPSFPASPVQSSPGHESPSLEGATSGPVTSSLTGARSTEVSPARAPTGLIVALLLLGTLAVGGAVYFVRRAAGQSTSVAATAATEAAASSSALPADSSSSEPTQPTVASSGTADAPALPPTAEPNATAASTGAPVIPKPGGTKPHAAKPTSAPAASPPKPTSKAMDQW